MSSGSSTQPSITVVAAEPSKVEDVKPVVPQPVKPAAGKSWLDIVQPFVIGGLSGCLATSVIQPIDMIKVTIQLKSEEISNATKAGKPIVGGVSPSSAIRDIYASGGIRAFYKGYKQNLCSLDSALMRQVFYTTTRLGIYKTIFEEIKRRNKLEGRNELSFAQKALCAGFAGFIGSLVGNPADLILIRIQADSRLPVDKRRNYKNVFNAFGRIVSEEGALALWRGATPTVIRATVLNLAMLASYDEVKERINASMGRKKDELDVRLGSSAISGILSAWASLPFDNAKTKIQKMTANADGTFPYKNIFDAMGKTIVNEGPLKLWVGFPTFAFRIAPHACITLVCQDILTDYVNKYRKERNI